GRTFTHRLHGFCLHAHHALGSRLAHGCGLVRDVDHPPSTLLIEMSQSFRHRHQDMRMSGTDGVLFDYGRTLVTFAYPTDELLRRQVKSNGIAGLVDAIVFSSEVGRRKPAPEVYQAALDAIATTADRTLFVGDRVREDYEGPRALGMRAVIVTRHADEHPPKGVPILGSLAEVPSLL